MDAVMVTGGRGFTGHHIAERLVACGRRVISYDRGGPSSAEGLAMAQGELFDVPRLLRVLTEHGVRQIVHTAALSHPTLSLDFPLATFEANVMGTLSLLEAARLAGVRRVVNFSSEAVYGPTAGRLTEDVAVRPTTPYAVTKVTTEWLGRVYDDRYGLEVVSLRIGQVYGPGDRMPEVLGDMLKALIRNGSFELERGGDHWFNFIHVRDVALAAARALDAPGPFPPPAYNISSSEYWRLGDAVEIAKRLFPTARVSVGAGPLGALDLQGPFDVTRARRDLGYEPEWPLDRGLADYARWLETHDV